MCVACSVLPTSDPCNPNNPNPGKTFARRLPCHKVTPLRPGGGPFVEMGSGSMNPFVRRQRRACGLLSKASKYRGGSESDRSSDRERSEEKVMAHIWEAHAGRGVNDSQERCHGGVARLSHLPFGLFPAKPGPSNWSCQPSVTLWVPSGKGGDS